MNEVVIKAICRLREKVDIPCNWVKEGYCGGDGRRCVILQFVTE